MQRDPENPLNSTFETMKNLSLDEPLARTMGIKCLEVGEGSAACSMTVTEGMKNLFGTAHGGAIFALMDEAFQLACNTRGSASYALNVSVTYVAAARVGDSIRAVAREISTTSRTGVYEITAQRGDGALIATAQAVAYRKKEPPPFL